MGKNCDVATDKGDLDTLRAGCGRADRLRLCWPNIFPFRFCGSQRRNPPVRNVGFTVAMRHWVLSLIILTGGTDIAAQEAAPLSAIDWLSRSVALEPVTVTPFINEPPVSTDATSPTVTVTPLDAPSPDPVGLLPSDVTGLPRDLWSGSDEATLVTLVQARPQPTLPAMQDFLTMLMLAEADPPLGAGPDGALFLARVDYLLDHARLEEALALLEAAGPDDSALFRRYFDVTLLTGTENQACRIMQSRPAVAPTYPARIFCLARSGDWPAAALTLNTHRVLGDVDEEEEILLSRFLDLELFEDDGLLPAPSRVSPLVFRIREAIGQGLNTSNLPLAFAHADLRDISGWKAQLAAAERLARNNALPANVLQGLFTTRTPSASGGVWDRVEAFQRFDVALTARDPVAVAATLPPAYAAMREIRAEVAFAALYAGRLQRLPLRREAGEVAFKLGLLSDNYEAVALANPERDGFLVALARGIPSDAPAIGARAEAIASGFEIPPPPRLSLLVKEGKLGEALLRSTTLFNAGLDGDLVAITQTLSFLRSVGLEDVARRTALQFMLLERPT